MVMMYIFDLNTGEYLGEREAQAPNGTPITESLTATPLAPPVTIPAGHVTRWTGEKWEVVEDHRQKMNEQGSKIGGTPYWLPEDNWQTPERFMEHLGPLPADALFEKPAKPNKTTEELAEEIRRERDRRIAGTDYLMAIDYPMTEAEREPWRAYRQSLRDIPAQPGFPWAGGGVDDAECPWPVKPENVR